MSHFQNILLTLGAGGVFGLIFLLLKVPNGLRIGALLGTALLSVIFRAAWMPVQTRFAVQVIAGALVGCTIERSDLKRLPMVIKPTAIMLASFLVLNFALGGVIYAISHLDWVTAMLCVVPGGVTDIPIIAADMGADTPKVALAQLTRYIMGVALFPPMILAFDTFMQKRKGSRNAEETSPGVMKREKSKVNSTAALVCTLLTAFAAGFAGNLLGIPAGAFLFSIAGIIALKLKFDLAYVSPAVKNAALLISGCYIGSLITKEDALGFRLLAAPLLLILGGYIANCFITGKILSKTCGFTRKESMLITTPAGASDIALNSADIGVQNTDIIIIHVFRAIVAAGLFPQIINVLRLLVFKQML